MGTPPANLSQQCRLNIHYQPSNASNSSLDTVQRNPHKRQVTPVSIRSLGSVSSSPLHIRSENTPPVRIFSRTYFHSADDASLFPSPLPSSKNSIHKPSWEYCVPIHGRSRTASSLMREAAPLEDLDLHSPHGTADHDDHSDKENQAPAAKEPRLSFDTYSEELLSINGPVITSAGAQAGVSPSRSATPPTSRSFKRWISHLRPHPLRRKKTLATSTKRWPIDDPPDLKIESPQRSKDERSGHRKSSSRSSAGLVDAVKGLAMARSTSTPVSRKSRRSNLFSRSNRGSKQSEDYTRSSLDHSHASTNPLDDAARERSFQRQKSLEELADSEASYVADLKVLIHVCEPMTTFPSQRLLTCPGLLHTTGISTQRLSTHVFASP